jgi:hypothetical protein
MGGIFSISSSRAELPSSLKVFPDTLKASAVITISNQGESCQKAVKSVIGNAKFFKDVHIAYFQGGDSTDYYTGWKEDEETLVKLGLVPIRHSIFNLQKLETLLRVDIPPDVEATEAAFLTLFDAMVSPSINEAGVASELALVGWEKPSPRNLLEAMFFHGFLIVLLMLDSMRSAFRLFSYNRTADLRATRMSLVYPNTLRPPPNRWYMWWLFTGVATTVPSNGTCTQDPSDEGSSLFVRTVKTHRHLSWIGIWWLGYFLYYVAFALPWWNTFMSPESKIGAWLMRDPFAWYWIMMYLFHSAIVGLVAWKNVPVYAYRLWPFHIIFYTVFLTLSPAVLVLTKVWQVGGKMHVHAAKKKQ